MQDDHPQKAVQQSGRQLRYLLGSDHGWLGGFVFASPAPQLVSRDAWIGWADESRKTVTGHRFPDRSPLPAKTNHKPSGRCNQVTRISRVRDGSNDMARK